MEDIPDSWEKYGFPDPTFRPIHKPYEGLIKAYNERYSVCRYPSPITVPAYFSVITTDRLVLPSTAQYILSLFDDHIRLLTEKVPAAETLRDCMWTWNELMLAGADGIEDDIIWAEKSYNFISGIPTWPVRWIIQRYTMLNLLRYYPTVWTNPPDFRYEDKNDTFNFKAPEDP